MNAKNDLTDIADALASDMNYMGTLLRAAEDKVSFYLRNRKLLSPNGELLYSCALELENLLSLMSRFLDRMDGEVETVTDCLYRSDSARVCE